MIVQGDVFLVEVEELPIDVKEVTSDRRGFVLAEGEATGHAHAIRDVEGVRMYEKEGTLYLKVEAEQAEIRHEEHLPVTVAKGLWKVGRVREHDPFEDRSRWVAD